MQLIYRTDLT